MPGAPDTNGFMAAQVQRTVRPGEEARSVIVYGTPGSGMTTWDGDERWSRRRVTTVEVMARVL